jgi:hypothetical protein
LSVSFEDKRERQTPQKTKETDKHHNNQKRKTNTTIDKRETNTTIVKRERQTPQ